MNEERLLKVCFCLTPASHESANNSFQSANYVRTELPVRIAHRLRDLQALPYVVVNQEGVARVYEVETLLFPPFPADHSTKAYFSYTGLRSRSEYDYKGTVNDFSSISATGFAATLLSLTFRRMTSSVNSSVDFWTNSELHIPSMYQCT